MKKIAAIILSIVLLFSFGIRSFASYSFNEVIILTPADSESETIIAHKIKNIGVDCRFYVFTGGTYYIALPDKAYTGIQLGTRDPVTAELVEYDPEKFIIEGLDVKWSLICGNETIEHGLSYNEAKSKADALNNGNDGNYDILLETNVNIIKISVEPNLSDEVMHYRFNLYAFLDGTFYRSYNVITCDNSLGEYASLLGISLRDYDNIPVTGAPAPM